jgi:hypothetical protein
MSKDAASSFIWMPGHGPDLTSLARMATMFPQPKKPMGEAWFMAPERKMYPELFSDLDTIPDEQIVEALTEIATGQSCFGPYDEWTDWYHYLLPRLIERDWSTSIFDRGELLITGFFSQYPDSNGSVPYSNFKTDILQTLGLYIMSPHFWSDCEVPRCLNKWQGPNGVYGWYHAEGLLSASLFLCIKYLKQVDLENWFRSVMAIPNLYWRAQIIVWLIGAHPILVGNIMQPSEFSEHGLFTVNWDWSHTLSGNYSGNFELPIHLIPFLPKENRETVIQLVQQWDIGDFFEELLTNPKLTAVVVETIGISEQFEQLYSCGTHTS